MGLWQKAQFTSHLHPWRGAEGRRRLLWREPQPAEPELCLGTFLLRCPANKTPRAQKLFRPWSLDHERKQQRLHPAEREVQETPTRTCPHGADSPHRFSSSPYPPASVRQRVS